MDRIESPDDLAAWLEDKPVAWAQVIALRIALRALPHSVSGEGQGRLYQLPHAVFYATIVAWAFQNDPNRSLRSGLGFAADFAHSLASSNLDNVVPAKLASYAVFAAAHAAYATGSTGSDAITHAVEAAKWARTPDWAQITKDCVWLAPQIRTNEPARVLANRPLWQVPAPAEWKRIWSDAASRLLEINRDYTVWIEWYDRRVRGETAAFDIPGDKDRREDKELLIRIAGASGGEFWGTSANYVNPQIALWLAEARERAAQNQQDGETEPSVEKLASKLIGSASPQAAVREGRLDAGPNAQLDKPTYTGDLPDLPAAMRSFITVLLNGLGENASAFMRSSLEGYREELVLRGTQPIVGTIKGLSQAIAREIWTAHSMAASDDPDEWEMRDEREWGAGMADLFRTFAKHNADLINHFPLDKEREDLLRQTPIDEVAASGDALTDPVALVTGLVRDLHGQGMATDNILRIMDAHAQYNRDIASLPPPPANLPDDYVTSKRRHVLMTAGFYLDLYSVMGSTASLAPAYASVGTILWDAAQSLLAFVR